MNQGLLFTGLLLAGSAIAQETATNSLGMELRLIEAGSYVRGQGAPRDEFYQIFREDHAEARPLAEEPAHVTFITRPFFIAKHEVTVAQFSAFVRATGHEPAPDGIVGFEDPGLNQHGRRELRPFAKKPVFSWKSPGFEQGDDHPVVGVSWDDAQAFCRWLTQKEGQTYRLPIEAEWELACKAGTQTNYSWGQTHVARFQRYANLADSDFEAAVPEFASLQWFVTGPGDGSVFTNRVGGYEPNPEGLFDVHGNVWEWCQDKFTDTTYNRWRDPLSIAVNPVNEDEDWNRLADWRVLRGGSFAVAPRMGRSSARSYFPRDDAACYIGFRVVREAPESVVAAAESKTRDQLEAFEAIKTAANVKVETTPHKTWRVRFSRPPPVEVVRHLLKFPRLTGLDCDWSNRELSPEVLEIIAQLTDLRELRLERIGSASGFGRLAALKKLEQLSITGRPGLSAAEVAGYPFLTNLNFLRLNLTGANDTDLAPALRAHEFPNLRELSLDFDGGGSGIAAFSSAPLEKLRLNRLDDDGAAVVGKFSGITSLQISTPEITGTGLDHLAGLSKLESLALTNLTQLRDGDFGALAGMTSLRELYLGGSGAGDLTAEVIGNLHLTKLSIGSPALTDAGMRNIGKIRSLRQLNVGRDAQITDDGLTYLWGPQNLDYMRIDVPGITGRKFELISNMLKLRRFHLNGSDFTDEGMRYLGYLPNLGSVELEGVHANLTDTGLAHLAEAPRLYELKIESTGTKMTDAGFENLRAQKPDLRLSRR